MDRHLPGFEHDIDRAGHINSVIIDALLKGDIGAMVYSVAKSCSRQVRSRYHPETAVFGRAVIEGDPQGGGGERPDRPIRCVLMPRDFRFFPGLQITGAPQQMKSGPISPSTRSSKSAVRAKSRNSA